MPKSSCPRRVQQPWEIQSSSPGPCSISPLQGHSGRKHYTKTQNMNNVGAASPHSHLSGAFLPEMGGIPTLKSPQQLQFKAMQYTAPQNTKTSASLCSPSPFVKTEGVLCSDSTTKVWLQGTCWHRTQHTKRPLLSQNRCRPRLSHVPLSAAGLGTLQGGAATAEQSQLLSQTWTRRRN